MHSERYPTLRSAAPDSTLLVVDDDQRRREVVRTVLRSLSLHVREADCGKAAISAIRARHFDLVLLDFRLPDISGLDVIAALQAEGFSVPWLLMSEGMTTALAVAAMKLGAINAVEMPFDVESVVLSALQDVGNRASPSWPRVRHLSPPSPRSAAERWAVLVLRGWSAKHDLRTIGEWAACVGVSYSALTESCRLVGIRPHDARDFLRMLRVLCQAGGRTEHLQHRLAVNDYRTLKALFERAGLIVDRPAAISLGEFIDRQRFLDPSCEAVRAMLTMIAECDESVPRGARQHTRFA